MPFHFTDPTSDKPCEVNPSEAATVNPTVDSAISTNSTGDAALPVVVFKSSWRPNTSLKRRGGHITTTTGDSITNSGEAMVDDDVASITSRTTTMDIAATKTITFSGTEAAPTSSLLGFQSVDEVLPAVLQYLTGATAPVPNSSTITLQRATPALLYELDRISQCIIESLIAHQAEVVVGTPLKFPEYDRAITLTRHVALAELQRYRRQYVKVNGSHPPVSSQAIGMSFIDYLALHI